MRKKAGTHSRRQFDGLGGGSRLGNLPFDDDPNTGFGPNRNNRPRTTLAEPVVAVTFPEPKSFQAGEWIMRPTAASDPPAAYRDRQIGSSRIGRQFPVSNIPTPT